MEIAFFAKKNDAFDSALLAALPNQYVPYDGTDLWIDGSDSVHLISQHNQEINLIKKDLFQWLSVDAHFVVKTINNQAFGVQTPKTKNITRRSIELFLVKRHWDRKRIRKVFMEIQGFVMQMSEID